MPIKFHRDGPWELPEGWVWARLGDVCKQQARIDPARQFDDQFQYIDLSAIDEGTIARPQIISATRAPSRARQLVQAGDTLLSCVRVYLRNNVMVPAELDGAVASSAFCVLRPSEVIDPRFLYWFIHSRKFTDVLVLLQRGNSPPAVLDDDVRDQLIPIAPFAEQRRIVARIDELFTEIADGETALVRARDNLDTWRRALLKAAVTGELTREWRETNKSRETGEDALSRIRKEREIKSSARRRQESSVNSNDGPSLPTGWAWATLEDLGSIESGQTPKGITVLATSEGEFPWFKVSSMNNAGPDGSISESQWYVSANDAHSLGLRIHPGGTIVFPKRGGSILTNKKRRLAVAGAFDLNTMGYIPHDDYAEYCWLFLRNLDLKRLYDGSNVPQINYGDIAFVRIAVPPPYESLEIARRTNDLLSAVHDMTINLEQGQRDATAVRQSILKAAFEGRLAEQDPRDEPADRLLARLSEQADTATRPRGARGPRRAALAVE